jgi:hypothetical protein
MMLQTYCMCSLRTSWTKLVKTQKFMEPTVTLPTQNTEHVDSSPSQQNYSVWKFSPFNCSTPAWMASMLTKYTAEYSQSVHELFSSPEKYNITCYKSKWSGLFFLLTYIWDTLKLDIKGRLLRNKEHKCAGLRYGVGFRHTTYSVVLWGEMLCQVIMRLFMSCHKHSRGLGNMMVKHRVNGSGVWHSRPMPDPHSLSLWRTKLALPTRTLGNYTEE